MKNNLGETFYYKLSDNLLRDAGKIIDTLGMDVSHPYGIYWGSFDLEHEILNNIFLDCVRSNLFKYERRIK